MPPNNPEFNHTHITTIQLLVLPLSHSLQKTKSQLRVAAAAVPRRGGGWVARARASGLLHLPLASLFLSLSPPSSATNSVSCLSIAIVPVRADMGEETTVYNARAGVGGKSKFGELAKLRIKARADFAHVSERDSSRGFQ